MTEFRHTVREFIQSKSYLVPAIAPDLPAVCPRCRGPHPKHERWPVCYMCGSDPFDALGFCTYATMSDVSNSGRIMYSYKSSSPSGEAEQIVSSLLFEALDAHGEQIPHPIDTVAIVPSISSERPPPHPLAKQVDRVMRKLRTELKLSDYLRSVAEGTPTRDEVEQSDFAWAGQVGTGVLLIDDTWVSGQHMRAAAYALRDAGFDHVSGLCAARWLTPGYQNCDEIIRLAAKEHSVRSRALYPANPFSSDGVVDTR